MEKSKKNTHKGTLLETTLANVSQMLDDSAGQPAKPSDQTSSRLEQNILFTIHRHFASLSWLIAKTATGKVRPRIRRILLWALAELIHLDGAPAHAVVDTATHFAKRRYAPQEAAFVNAFLRRITDAQAAGQPLFDGAPESVHLEMPDILWKRWTGTFGEEAARELARVILEPAPIVFRRQLWPPSNAHLPDCLAPIAAPDWMPQAQLCILNRKHVQLGRLMDENPQLYIQDTATLLAPAMLAPQPDETVADLCAAPGGKARLIAELMQNRGKLFLRDKAADKLPRIASNLQAFSCADIAQGDAASPALAPASLDALLLDVPCTNTGVLRRKPDAKWTFDDKKLGELAAIQRAILDATAPLLKHGGRLVYSTCSLEPEENSMQIAAFLERHAGQFALEEERQLLPADGHDGAYAARLRRT